MSTLTVIILTYNESIHIQRAISSVKDIATEIFIIDSFSSDLTEAIAKANGAKVLKNAFVTQATQFQWALDHAPITSHWIMRLDADEVIEPDLSNEIKFGLSKLSSDIVGINLKRKHIFMGRWIKHGGRYPVTLLRIWRAGHGTVEDRWMDEHIVVRAGRSITFDGGFADVNLNNLTYFIDKHNRYATREAIDVIGKEMKLFESDHLFGFQNSSFQARSKRWLKENLYNRLPFTVSSLSYFLWRYIFQLGFLDGRSGLIYHFLQGYWYRFLVGAKLIELRQAIAHLTDKDAIRAELSRLTGHDLNKKEITAS